jgi:hypothetical protein
MPEHDQSEKLPGLVLLILLIAAGLLWILIWAL